MITSALPAYVERGEFPQRSDDESVEDWGRRLRFRETDLFVNRHLAERDVKMWPLSVSSDQANPMPLNAGAKDMRCTLGGIRKSAEKRDRVSFIPKQ